MPVLRHAHIYLEATGDKAIVAALYHNSAGILFEQEEPAVIEWRQPSLLAAALRSALEQFSLLERNLREYKKTEWPSYQASRSRSVREFETTYICINVQALNEAELFYDASAYPHNERDVALHVLLDRYKLDEEINRKMLKLFNACINWPR